jgi:hypothetical protein
MAHRSWDEAALFSRRIRHVLPVGLVQRIATSIEVAQRPRLRSWQSASSPKLFFAGNDPLFRALISGAFGCELERAGYLTRAGVRPSARFDADVVVLEIPSPSVGDFARAGWVVMPRWVAMEVDLRRPLHELLDPRKREIVRRVQRSSLELEVARGAEAAREFHERMYAPTARARHGPRAIVVRQAYIRAAVRSGQVLFVRSHGRRQAGLLVVARPGRERALDALLFGVADGDYARSKLVREAAYFFAVKWARDTYGAVRLGLTGAAPFANDGGLQFKKHWGASASADLRQATCIAIRVQRGSVDVARALGKTPLIALRHRDRSLCALLTTVPDTAPLDAPNIRGVDVARLEIQSAEDLPERLDLWAKSLSQ